MKRLLLATVGVAGLMLAGGAGTALAGPSAGTSDKVTQTRVNVGCRRRADVAGYLTNKRARLNDKFQHCFKHTSWYAQRLLLFTVSLPIPAKPSRTRLKSGRERQVKIKQDGMNSQ